MQNSQWNTVYHIQDQTKKSIHHIRVGIIPELQDGSTWVNQYMQYTKTENKWLSQYVQKNLLNKSNIHSW